jgi:hypothetical protein
MTRNEWLRERNKEVGPDFVYFCGSKLACLLSRKGLSFKTYRLRETTGDVFNRKVNQR